MKKSVRWILGIVLSIGLLFIGVSLYFEWTWPRVEPATDLTINSTPGMVERGAYLANHVAVCIDCHSQRDWTKFAGPPIPGTEGAGGEAFTREMGFPGDFYAPNITPYGLKYWSDGEILRAMTEGVNKENDPLFPVMPYHNYGKMDPKDAHALIAYLRNLGPVPSEIPESKASFPFSLIMRTIPQKADPQIRPEPTDSVAFGLYLTTLASCGDCHTRMEKGKPVPGMEMAGGREFVLPFGILRSPNLTPDPETGLGSWDKETFIDRFKMYTDSTLANMPVQAGEFNTLMPWTMYAGMSEEDLGAIYDYLQSLDPIHNPVVRVELNQK